MLAACLNLYFWEDLLGSETELSSHELSAHASIVLYMACILLLDMVSMVSYHVLCCLLVGLC